MMVLLSLVGSGAIVLTRLADPNDAVLHALAESWPLTSIVTLAAPALSGLLGVGLGLLLSADRGGRDDAVLRNLVLTGCALCLSWAAIVSALWFAVAIGLGPVASDVVDADAGMAGNPGQGVLNYLLIPAVAVVFGSAAVIAVHVRATARSVSGEQFLQTMRSRGLPTTALVGRRVLRRSALPILAVLAAELVVAFGCALAAQAVLASPAPGGALSLNVPAQGLPVVLALVLVGAVGIVVAGVPAAARFGAARFGAARFGAARFGAARFGTARFTPAQFAPSQVAPLEFAPSQPPALPGPAVQRGSAATLPDYQPAAAGTLPSTSFRAADFLDIRDLGFTPAGSTDVSQGAGISLTVQRGETLAVIGDASSGTSTLCLAIAGLLPAGVPVRSGSILVDGHELVGLPERDFSRLRGHLIGYLAAPGPHRLDPRARLGRQVLTLLARQPLASRSGLRQAAADLFASVGIEKPEAVLRAYPYEVSAETAQRVLLAGVLAPRPQLLVAHDPTLGLDAAAETEFLDLLHAVRREAGFTLIVSSARVELAVRCDRVAVMSSGTIVEHASVGELFTAPQHPHTRLLLAEREARRAPAQR
ncbi:ATP-binding cassette domain-containing protein [Cryobacterium sp. SO2]|uniref:ATP-binding cassette domain-containing protein n=1 Tax=Cryobacterium sp. SO2 TaxID=1897060 RepID=UPI00223C90CB|nr:ATP-binding cassette domain-containing protein [Cryobacterium sp. SO2]WEO77774.1 ATP-binding cassette domain-containing protein [Cryobacterium sp. SO2]